MGKSASNITLEFKGLSLKTKHIDLMATVSDKLYYNGFVHNLLKFPNINIFKKAFFEQREYEENVFKINLSQCITLIKRKNNMSFYG